MPWRRKLEDVAETLRNAEGSCVVLIGAGCSLSAGIPSANSLIREIEHQFPCAYARAEDKKNYNKVMGQLAPSERRKLLGGYIEKAKINWAHLALAQMLSSQAIDRVLTVNFDPLLIRACAVVGIYPAVYDLATARQFRSSAIAPRSVFYLNGQHAGFAMLNDECELAEHRRRLEEIVRETGVKRTWLVIGYSGDADPLLDVLADQPEYEGRLYWIGHDADPSPGLQKKLLECPGKYAFYVGGQDADEFLSTLAQRLDCFPPEILVDPLRSIERVVANIDFSTGRELGQSIRESLETKIRQGSAPVLGPMEEGDELEKWLLAGQYDRVVAWYAKNENPSDQERDWVSWAAVMQANALMAEAQALKDADLVGARKLWSQAGEKYGAALAIKPDKHEALYNWGTALAGEAQALKNVDLAGARELWSQAGEKYCAALAIKPDEHDALINWGTALAGEAKALKDADLAGARDLWSQAGEKYRATLAINPDDHDALFNWGNALAAEAQALKDADLEGARELWSQAGEKYRAALAIKPYMYQALGNMAVLCGRLYRTSVDPLERSMLLKEMRSYAQQTEKLAPGAGAYNLACSYALENDVEECLRWLDVSRERGRLPDAEHLRKDLDLSSVRDHEKFTAWWSKNFPDVSGGPSKAPVA